MNHYSNNLLKQFKVKHGRLYYLRGPLTNRPAGHTRPNGVTYVKFDGYTYRHEELLFLYKQQLEAKSLESIDPKLQYETISGYPTFFYNTVETAPPYVIHGAIRIDSRWHACQWTDKGEAPNEEYNLRRAE